MNVNWKRRRVLQLSGALVLSSFLPRWGRAEIPILTGPTMGTRFKVQTHHVPDGLYLPKLKRAIEQVFRNTESLMSTYRSDSELSLFNASTSTDWQPILTDTARVAETALKVQRQSRGAFNPASGSLVNHWGFGAKPSFVADVSKTPPTQVLASVHDANIELKPGYIRKDNPQAMLDLNGIAKGDAIDGVATLLEQTGIADYLIEIGGEIRARGSGPEGAEWRVGLENPTDSVLTTIRIGEKSVATSGDYVNYFMRNGIRYSHVVDPRAGKPIDHNLASVSVVADTAMQADAWATALLVMGLEEGYRHAQRNSMAAFFLQRDGAGYRSTMTSEFEQLIVNSTGFSA